MEHPRGSSNIVCHASTLPAPFTSLIGREQEIAAVCTLLAHPEARLLTLTGAGGVGKTRLAVAIANEIQGTFPDGVDFVSLASIQDAGAALPTIVQALDLHTSNRPPLETLQAELGEQRRLLVIDNFETVIAAAPSLLDLLAACPRLKLLVTSREVLHVRGEREIIVQPLALPDPQHLPDTEALAHYGAVALFLERAREVQPALQLTTVTVPLITEICHRLDGLPLALELAAARLKVLSLQALLERLEHRLQVLTGGPRDLPARQQTLRNTITWSYNLLAEEEQRLFRLLAIFADGCDLSAVEAVYTSLGGEHERVLDMVTSLLDKHLLHQRAQDDATVRLLMHETIREYGLEMLAANQELEAARHGHAAYYLRLAEQANTYLEGAQQAVWLARLERDYANLRAALHRALDRHDGTFALRLGNALFHFWEGHWRRSDGRNFLEQALAISQDAPADVRSKSLFVIAALALVQGDHERSAALGREAASLQRELGDWHHLAWSLYLLGANAWVNADLTLARSYTQEGFAVARPADDTIILAYLHDLSGQIALEQGDDTKARALLEDGLMLHRVAGDTRGILGALFFLERILLAQGEVAQARACAEEQLTLSRAIDFRPSIAGALSFLGRVALVEGNTAAAAELFEESLTLLLRDVKDSWPVAVVLQGIGVTVAAVGRLAAAIWLWGAAEALCAATDTPLPPDERAFVERARMRVLSQLSDEAFASAWAEGRAMTPEQALAAAQTTLSRKPRGQARRCASGVGAHHQPPSFSLANSLTAREVEVLRLVAQGLTDAQIAESLVISPRTVNAHLRSIYAKLNVSSRNAATYFALEHGLM